MGVQNDFADLRSSKDDQVLSFKEEIEPDELVEVKVEDSQAMMMKVLEEVKNKIRGLEENEKNLRKELTEAKNELKKKKEKEDEKKQVSVIIQDKKEEMEVEGFWSTVCRIGKGIFGSILAFLGIRI